MGLDIPGICYSAFLAGGGIMGFIQKGSVMSGVAGVSLGTLAGYGAYQASHNNRYEVGWVNSSVVYFAMAGRWFKTKGKSSSALGIGLVSLGMATYYGVNLFKQVMYVMYVRREGDRIN